MMKSVLVENVFRPKKRDPPCKDTMRFGIDNQGDRMCRVEAFNVVSANDTSDDGFSWSIEGQAGIQYRLCCS